MMRLWAARADAANAWHHGPSGPADPADPSDPEPEPAPDSPDSPDAPAGGADGDATSGTMHLAVTYEGITEIQATLTADAGAPVEAASSWPWPTTVSSAAPSQG